MSKRADLVAAMGLELPVVAAPMFIVSQMELVSACRKAGVLGTFPALNNRSTAGLEKWCQQQNDLDARAPYGVNLIVHKTNPRVQADLQVCAKYKVPVVITSLGAVSELVSTVHSYGGLVFHDVTNTYHAQKAIEAGVDGLVLVAAGAGGHGGKLNPIPFVHEVRSKFDGIILLAGCLSTGGDVATAMQMGADLAYMGTRFINTDEAAAPPDYQEMIKSAGTADIIYTAAVSGIPGNYIAQSLKAAGVPEDLWGSTAKIDLGEKLNSDAKAWKDIWSAGQGVASISDRIATAALVSRMRTEFLEALARQHVLASKYIQ